MKKYYRVVYRHNLLRDKAFGVKGQTSKVKAINKTHLVTSYKERVCYKSPIAYLISEEEFNELKRQSTECADIKFD